ncbi:hypothetical protein LCM08_05770 [Salipiger pacificus]|uniref:hypothetical protein n=1 Tax=Alloyangia mangrovi TaxID=1779329 RepID=UPI001CD74D62|nr:hypothetical protein [Alloyangia mangrovi]MCA0941072.1 hypothetical protein [Alloyangia pacifica]MCA0944412.1 hypothetical protein [Alloyangia pacifica]
MQNDPLDVRCSECGKAAQFFEPFRFTCVVRLPEVPENSHVWGRVIVEELFPEQFSWEQPACDKPKFLQPGETGEGYRLNERGMVWCKACKTFEAATISWPEDAFWKLNVKGHELVARNREHAEQILGFLQETQRAPNRKPALRGIPTALLTRRLQQEVSSRLERALATA